MEAPRWRLCTGLSTSLIKQVSLFMHVIRSLLGPTILRNQSPAVSTPQPSQGDLPTLSE